MKQADEIVKILNNEKGEEYAAIWTGATDKGVILSAKIITINRGKGFEKCVKAEVPEGSYIYMPPFEIDSFPIKDTMFVFKCNDAIFLSNEVLECEEVRGT